MDKRFADQIQQKVEFETPDGRRFETAEAAAEYLAVEADVAELTKEIKHYHWDFDLDDDETSSLARWILTHFVRRPTQGGANGQA